MPYLKIGSFQDVHLYLLELVCEINNVKSRAIPEKLGLPLEGKLRANHKLDGKYQDDLLFSLLRSEYQEVK